MSKTLKLSAKVYFLIALAICISLAQYYFYNQGQEKQNLLQTFFVITSRFKNETAELKYHILLSAHDGITERVLKTYKELLKTIDFSTQFYGNTDIDFKKKDYVLQEFDKLEKIIQSSYEDYLITPKDEVDRLKGVIEQVDSALKVISDMIIEMVAYTDHEENINKKINIAFSLSSVFIVIIILAVIIVPQIIELENLNIELTASNTLRESIQNSSPNGILFVIKDQIYLYNNTAKDVIKNLSGKDIKTGDKLENLLIDELVKDEFLKGIKETVSGNIFHGYFSHKNPDGNIFYYKVLFYPVFDIRTKSYGTSIIFSNITKEILAQQQIKKSEQYYRTIIDNSHGIIFTLSEDFYIKFASHLAEKYFNTRPQNLEGTNFLELVHENDRQRVEFFLKKVSNNLVVEDQIQFYLNSETHETILMGKCGIIEQENSKEIILLCIDITTQVKNEEKLQIQNEKLREIAWLQSHVIRRPVANALGICEVLMNKDLLNNGSVEFSNEKLLELLFKEIKKIDEVIHRINEKT
ncbi:MAG: PAS domain-containing protein [Thermaurantimonas aggregans]|nr:PAS domain-containing protein [Thermaurantimonas aggregans]